MICFVYLNQFNNKLSYGGVKSKMANFIIGIISLTIGVVVLANVFITTVKGANTTGWTTAEVALWGLLTIAGIAGIVYGVLNVFGLM